MTQTYDELGTAAGRAQQIWLILLAFAMCEQTVTYENLAERMGLSKHAARFLSQFLGPVYYYCDEHKLPPLTSIVVDVHTGVPGWDGGFDISKVPALQRKVYDFDWYSICPPSRRELELFRIKWHTGSA